MPPKHSKTKNAPPTSDLERPAALRESFFVLIRAFNSLALMMELLLEEYRLNKVIRPGMGHVLFALWQQDDVTMTTLAERTRLPASTLTRVTGEMEKVNLVNRTRCAHDGRAVRIQLTPLGRSLETIADQVVSHLREVVEAGMSKAEVNGVKDGLAAMIDNMEGYQQKRIAERSSDRARGRKLPRNRSNGQRVEAVKPKAPKPRPTP